jgi:hypothetical protein
VRDLLVAHHHLHHSAGLAQVEERDAAVVAALGDPSGEGDGLADVLGAESAGVVGADHDFSISVGELRELLARLARGGRRGAGPRWRVGGDLLAAADVLDLVLAAVAREPDERNASALRKADLLAELLGVGATSSGSGAPAVRPRPARWQSAIPRW